MPSVRCVSHLPSKGGLADCFRVSVYSDLAGLPSSCVLGSDSWSPSNVLFGDCQCFVFFLGLILLGVLWGNPWLKGTPGFPSPRGMPLVLPRHTPKANTMIKSTYFASEESIEEEGKEG